MKDIVSNDFSNIENFSTKQTLNESAGMIYFGISAALFGISNFQMKLLRIWFPDEFSESSYILWRSIPLIFVAYYLMKQTNEEILKVQNLENKFWFAVRMLSNFLSTTFCSLTLNYLRAATTGTLISMYPLTGIFFAICILKEKFYYKYLIFTLIGFLCSLMMISNDKNYQSEKAQIDSNSQEGSDANLSHIIIGSFTGILALVSVSLVVTSTKVLINQKISFNNQLFYIGVSNSFLAVVLGIFTLNLSFNLIFVFTCGLNSIIYYYALSFMNFGLENVDAAKTSPLAYFGIITTFILGTIILGEPIYFTDILGSLMIVACNVYYSRI